MERNRCIAKSHQTTGEEAVNLKRILYDLFLLGGVLIFGVGCRALSHKLHTHSSMESDTTAVHAAADSTAVPDSAGRDTVSAEKDVREKGISDAEKLLIRACDNYMKINDTANPKIVEVLNIKASVLYNVSHFDRSREVYKSIIERYPDNPFAVDAVKMIAQSYYEEKDFVSAQQWYAKLKNLYDDVEDKQEVIARIAESIFRRAESLEKQQRLNDAAVQYERVAIEFPQVAIADVALFNAGLIYEKLTQWTKSVLMFQRLIQKYPESKLMPKAIFRTAKSYEKLHQWENAAQTYLRVIAKYPSSELAPAAMYNAGFCFENAEKIREAAAVFEKMAELYPQSDDAADVLFKAGELYGQIKDWESVSRVNTLFTKRYGSDKDRIVQALCMVGIALYMQGEEMRAQEELRKAVNTFNSMKNPSDVNRYYAAKAAFTIGEIFHEKMKAITLVQPQRVYKELLKKKSSALEQAVDAYSSAVGFGISEWITRGIFQMGAAYEHFALGIFKQQRPPLKTIDNRIAFELGVAEAVEKYFVQKALYYHEKNVRLGIEQKIEDQAILDSRKRLTHLPYIAGKNFLAIVDIAKGITTPQNSTGFALITQKLDMLQKVAPFQERAIELFLTSLEKGMTYQQMDETYDKASTLITRISYSVGETYADVAQIAREAPIPENFDAYETFIYKTKLLGQIERYEQQALKHFLRTLNIADAYTLGDQYVTATKEQIPKLLFIRGRCYDLLCALAFNDPPYPDGIGEREEAEYRARFEEAGLRFQEIATEQYERILEYAGKNYAQGEYCTHAYVRLYQQFPNEYGVKSETVVQRTVTSGPNWKCSEDSVGGWMKLTFDDLDWKSAMKGRIPDTVSLKGFPESVPPPMWLAIKRPNASYRPARKVFFRKTFYNRGTPRDVSLYIAGVDKIQIYFNGKKLSSDSTQSGRWNDALQWNLTEKIREGKNVLAVKVINTSGEGYGLLAYLPMEVTSFVYLPKPPGTDTPLSIEAVSIDNYVFPYIKNFSSEPPPRASAKGERQ
jgi:TolA-binding protein